MKEIWKKIDRFGENYKVSNLGRIFVKKHTLIDRFGKEYNVGGYKTYGNITLSGYLIFKGVPVHRIVIETFRGYSSLDAHHKDFIKTNNRLDNLEYLTKSEHGKKKTVLQKQKYRRNFKKQKKNKRIDWDFIEKKWDSSKLNNKLNLDCLNDNIYEELIKKM